jgi:LPS sulfotransferase NodH
MADTRFVLVATPRTGSTLLVDLLSSHPEVFCDNELYNPHQICRHGFNEGDPAGLSYRNADPVRFWKEFYFSEFAKTRRAIGFNFMLGHDHRILDRILGDAWLKIVFVTRENKLAQYASYQLALATQRWSVVDDREAAAQTAFGPLTFDFRSFEQWLQEEMTLEYLFTRLAALLTSDVLTLEYRQLLDPETHRRLCQHLGVAHAPLRATLRKQNANRILSRFANPDEVGAYLETIGKEAWGLEELPPARSPGPGTGIEAERPSTSDSGATA